MKNYINTDELVNNDRMVDQLADALGVDGLSWDDLLDLVKTMSENVGLPGEVARAREEVEQWWSRKETMSENVGETEKVVRDKTPGYALRFLRANAGLSMGDLARLLKTDVSTISSIELNSIDPLNGDTYRIEVNTIHGAALVKKRWRFVEPNMLNFSSSTNCHMTETPRPVSRKKGELEAKLEALTAEWGRRMAEKKHERA